MAVTYSTGFGSSRTLFDHVDGEMQRLRDLRHTLRIVARISVMDAAAEPVAVCEAGADCFSEHAMRSVSGK